MDLKAELLMDEIALVYSEVDGLTTKKAPRYYLPIYVGAAAGGFKGWISVSWGI